MHLLDRLGHINTRHIQAQIKTQLASIIVPVYNLSSNSIMRSCGSTKAAMAVGVVLVVVVLVISNAPASEAAITCSQVVSNLRPCVNYLTKGSGKPPAACCSGVSALASAASSSTDKKAACDCIKSAAKSVNPKPQLAQSLPANCGISLPFPVSPNTDCSKIG